MNRTRISIAVLIMIVITVAAPVGRAKSSAVASNHALLELGSSIYIRADGSIDPPYAPIQRNSNVYTLTDNIVGEIGGFRIERDNVTLNGAGHLLQGTGASESKGIELADRRNVTVKAVRIRAFSYGVVLFNSSDNLIIENDIESSDECGILFSNSSNNRLFHNNFNNSNQTCLQDSINTWDNGYPSGGNYWKDFKGNDTLSGNYQTENGSDGIGDNPYIIDVNNNDTYPLMTPWLGPVRNLDTGKSFADIQSAIYDATEKERILVLSNTYYGSLFVSKSLELFGEAAETTIIDGNGIGTVININSSNVNISRLTIRGGGNIGVLLNGSSNSTIQHSYITSSQSGIVLHNSSNNVLSGNKLWYTCYGIVLDTSIGNEISKNSIKWSSECSLRLSSSKYNNASQNVFTGNFDGIVLDNSSNNNLEENAITSSYNCGIKVINSSDNNTISSNNVTGSTTEGIRLFSSKYNTIYKNSIRENGGDGIDLLLNSNYNNISQNSIEENNYGISLYAYSNNNSLSYNILSGNTIGVKLEISSNNSICNNKVHISSNDGIYLRSCLHNIIDGNSVEDAGYLGIQLYCSPNNLLRNNMMVNNRFGFGVDGWGISDFANDVDTSNTVNGKPVFYLTNRQGVFVPSTVGCVILINCSNITIQNLNLTANQYGVLLFETTNVLISGTSISFNQNGIYAVNSSDCTIYHNNFRNNMRQIYMSGSVNIWDGGYPSGGNYWSDYAGIDANNDGIGEHPYVIDASNQDNSPFVGPITIFNVGTWNDETYFVSLVTNSTISDFRLNTDQTPESISFSVEGPNATTGFCRICVPDSLLEGPYAVLVNGAPVSQNTVTNGTHTFIHFTYNHSWNLITVIGDSVVPEFPHTMILFIFMMIALLASAMYPKALRHRHDRKTC